MERDYHKAIKEKKNKPTQMITPKNHKDVNHKHNA